MSSRFFARGGEHTAPLRRARPGVRTPHARDGCRTEILPDLRCEPNVRPGGGRRLEPCGPRANFADMSWRACRQCGGELFGAPVFPEKYGECVDEQKRSYSCRTAEILPEHPRGPHGTSPRSSRRSLWRHEALGSPHAVMANMRGLLGPFPTAGNGPRRTRRLRVTLSTEHDPVVFQY